jgi:hypothetical protein
VQASAPDEFAATAVPAQAAGEDAFEQLALTIDPNAFNPDGTPNDFIGTITSQIDSDLANTVFGPEVNTIADQVICLLDSTCTDILSTVPTTSDDGFTVLEQFAAQEFIPSIARDQPARCAFGLVQHDWPCGAGRSPPRCRGWPRRAGTLTCHRHRRPGCVTHRIASHSTAQRERWLAARHSASVQHVVDTVDA